MKNRFLIIAIAVSAVSCAKADFLNQVPFSQTSPENYYKTQQQMEMALVSCYETINTHKIPGYSFCQRGSYAQGLLYIMNAPSDDVVAAQSSNDEGLEMEWGNYVESTRCIRDFWKVFYAGINRCNIILQYIDGIEASPEIKTQFKAEARFMRAFFYYHLAWNFGGVPIVKSYASDGYEPRSALKDVYEFILADLDFARDNLADAGILGNISANRFTADAYIGRICNYLASCKRYNVGADLVAEQPLNDFAWVDAAAMTTKAKNALKEVVEESHYILVNDYTNLFRETTKSEQYKECLLLAESPLSGKEGYWPNSFYLPSPTSNGVLTPIVYGGRHIPTPRGFYMYHESDRRRDHNFTGRISDGYSTVLVDGYTYSYPNMQHKITVTDEITHQQKEVLHPLYENERQTYLPVSGIQLCAGKVRLAAMNEVQHTWQQSAFSFPLMRLADVYLMYAEALYFDGNEPDARVWMNKVLERAAIDDDNYTFLKTYYHRDDFIDELLESRERELVFEFSRKWDLIRFNRIDAAIASLNENKVVEREGIVDDRYLNFDSTGYLRIGIPNLKQNWQHHKIWLPISEEQMGVNQSLVQNAGWGVVEDKS